MKLKNILLKNKAILIYFLCSAGAALLETGLLYLFKNTIPALKSNIVLANTMAVIVSGCAHYVLTSKFVFQVKMNLASMTAYLITFFIGLGIQNAVIWVAYEKLLPSLIANDNLLTLCSKGLSLIASFFITYILRKYINAQINKRETARSQVIKDESPIPR